MNWLWDVFDRYILIKNIIGLFPFSRDNSVVGGDRFCSYSLPVYINVFPSQTCLSVNVLLGVRVHTCNPGAS